MAHENQMDTDRRALSQLSRVSAGDRGWLALALGAGVAVYAAYLLTHDYPAYAGGMYVQMGEAIVANGYALPETIPFYANGGVPFAYPPLGFYMTAVLRDVGVPPVVISLYLPGAFVVAYLVPYYAIARDLIGTPRLAGLATILFAVTPTVLRWHLSAGGFIRSLALLFALTAIYASLRCFRTGDRRWLLPATGFFALTVLTHPVYTVFAGLSCLLAYVCVDRTWAGLVSGAVIPVGAFVITAPWWLQVAATHGVDVFTTASGTHSGLLGGPDRLLSQFVYPVGEESAFLDVELNAETAFYWLAYAGIGYAAVARRYLLAAWAVTASYVIGKNRFLFVAGAMVSALLVVDAVIPAIRRRAGDADVRRLASLGAVTLLVLATGTAGAMYAGGALDTAHDNSSTQPAFMDAADESAMAWATANTEPTARFAVAGDAAEWFPLFTNRSIVLGPWGYEWKDTEGYYEEVALFKAVCDCRNATCLTDRLASANRHPDYVYLPKGDFTTRGKEDSMPPAALARIGATDRYTQVYENRGVAIYRVADWPSNASAPRAR